MGLLNTLQNLPTEVLVNIFSYLEEADFTVLEQTSSKFASIISDEELWKSLFIKHNHTSYFPSYSQSSKYSIEYRERNKALNQWRHNRGVSTKYTISQNNHDSNPQHQELSHVVFDYPRCACYNDGLITFLQLHAKRRKDRVVYIQCTTPHGCSVMHFNINAVVFGRVDGRVFGKLFTNRSYLSPVVEFDNKHDECVTAIATAAYEDSSQDWCISGSERGELIWWSNAKLQSRLRVSNSPINKVYMNNKTTLAFDEDNIHIIEDRKELYSINLAISVSEQLKDIRFVEVDFGGMLVILASSRNVYVISINPHKDIGFTRRLAMPHAIEDLVIDKNTARRKIDHYNVAGGNGCFIAVLLSDNTVKTVNVRAPGSSIKEHLSMSFHEKIHICQINNLVLACAFSGKVAIYDALSSAEIRVIQGTEKYPQYLQISDGKFLLGSGNVLHYHQYISAESKQYKRANGKADRTSKIAEAVKSQLRMFDEDEYTRQQEIAREERLRRRFVGDLEDEELQLQIALMESESMGANIAGSEDSFDESLQRVLEDSRLQHEAVRNSVMYTAEDEEEMLLRALEQSRLEAEQFTTRSRDESND
ncbi:HDL439Cp [Eremothecium sinecaudum]|uniref:HDL439Cp n=1 Tax=Eremothecium sinecaudum TaxID=45286 RepID=A0A0X8HRU7_9SACH|nr:HDL439Cp [Eremothecium sinecaudum]AMD20305.1 HDL439Cp [Eremothecium sinecaudum]